MSREISFSIRRVEPYWQVDLVVGNNTNIDLGFHDVNEAQELADHLRDIANELDPQEEE